MTMALRRNSNITVLSFINEQIEQLQNSNRFGTALNYKKANRSFSQFLDGRDIEFKYFSEQLIQNYNSFLIQHGMVRNSVSFYMRIMRSVYNKAVKKKLVKQTYPFSDVYTGVDHTRKRAVHQSVVSSLYKLELSEKTSLSLSRDIFIFSYCARGMSFVDIAYLKKNNLQNGFITYTRRKTGQLLRIKIEQVIERILSKYNTSNGVYVFPLISSLDERVAYGQYLRAINTYNRHLFLLSKMISCDCKLTSYTSRHSWATSARNNNIPISIISAAMGHTSEHSTRIYLDSIDNDLIDEANERIIIGII